MCRGTVEHVGENMPFARGNVVLLRGLVGMNPKGRLFVGVFPKRAAKRSCRYKV